MTEIFHLWVNFMIPYIGKFNLCRINANKRRIEVRVGLISDTNGFAGTFNTSFSIQH